MKFLKFLALNILFINYSIAIIPSLIPAEKKGPERVLFKDLIEIQQKSLEEEKSGLITKQQIANSLDSLKAQINQINERLKNSLAGSGTQEFLQRKLSILNQKNQIILEMEQVQQQILTIIDEHAKLLNEYKEDPDFKKLLIPLKSYYLFNEELQELSRKKIELEEKIVGLEDKKQSTLVDLNNRKKALSIISQEYKEKERQQEDFSLKSAKQQVQQQGNMSLTLKEQGELIDEQKKLVGLKRELAQLRVKEAELRENYLKFQLEFFQGQLNVISSEYERIKRLIRIDDSFLHQSSMNLEKKRQDSLAEQQKFQEKIRILLAIKEGLKRQLNVLFKRFNGSQADISMYADWTKDTNNMPSWGSLCSISNVLNHNALLDAQKDYLDANIDLEKLKFKKYDIDFQILRTWQKMLSGSAQLESDEEVDQEIKYYNSFKNELAAEITSLNEKRSTVGQALNGLNRMYDNLKAKIKALKDQKDSTFKDHSTEYTECLALLNDAEEQLKLRIDTTSRLLEIYSNSISAVNSANKSIDHIIIELNSKSFWRSSNEALINRIKNFIPDIETFFKDFYKSASSFFVELDFKSIFYKVKDFFFNFRDLFILLCIIIFTCLIFLFFHNYLDEVRASLLNMSGKSNLLFFSSHALIILLDFLHYHYVTFIAWLTLFLIVKFTTIFGIFLSTTFYLISIIYLLYLANRFINYLVLINENSGHAFLSKSYQQRFSVVLSFFLYSTIILMFFRQAFLLGNYAHSDVPTVLYAINFIILQISLICLIGREQILSMIPNETPLWQLISEKVDKYYYIIVSALIFLIIISNPYVGFGKQVLFILFRVLLTALLISVFSFIHYWIRKASSDIFFYYDGETTKERFRSGKTWYGLFVITIFACLFAFVIGLVVRIWGYRITFNDLYNWINEELPIIGYNAAGKAIPVTPFSFIKIFLFVFAGFIIAYLVNRFILQRIFALLLVNTGIQSMLLTLTRYTIIIVSILIAIQNAGLSATLWYFAALIGGIAFAMKEPVSDVISYFIILVQRPVKIGDFIMIDEENFGVVRHITPRSVLLRRRNSVTIVVPNSHFITKPVTNWNLSRSFFAFNDIMLTIPYEHDPIFTRDLIMKVLHSNMHILKNPAPIVWLSDFNDHGYRFLVRGYLSADKVMDQWEIASDVRLEIVKNLRKNNMDIAQPTRIIKVVPGSQMKIVEE